MLSQKNVCERHKLQRWQHFHWTHNKLGDTHLAGGMSAMQSLPIVLPFRLYFSLPHIYIGMCWVHIAYIYSIPMLHSHHNLHMVGLKLYKIEKKWTVMLLNIYAWNKRKIANFIVKNHNYIGILYTQMRLGKQPISWCK